MSTHIKSFNIYDFRGIKNLKLDDLKGINIITGDNNTGKTSVLEVINYLSGAGSLSNLAFSTIRGINAYNQSSTQFSPYERIQYLFPIDQKNSTIHYSFEMKNVIDIKIKRGIKHEVLSQRELNKINGRNESFNKISELVDEYRSSLGFLEKMEEIEICDLEFLINNKVLKKGILNYPVLRGSL